MTLAISVPVRYTTVDFRRYAGERTMKLLIAEDELDPAETLTVNIA